MVSRGKRDVSDFFFFDDPATTEIYTLSLHDALPISRLRALTASHLQKLDGGHDRAHSPEHVIITGGSQQLDRKSTRLNSSHMSISYAVFCLKKKIEKETEMKLSCEQREIERSIEMV